MEEYQFIENGALQQHDPRLNYCDLVRQELNYKSATKRTFLNECIRQIYIIHGNDMPMISIPAEYNKIVIWTKINRLMQPPRKSIEQVLIEKVKRRLFWETRKKKRKSHKPKLNNSKISEIMHFKPWRNFLAIKHIRRNYLTQARQTLCQKRKHTNLEDDIEVDKSPISLSINEDFYQILQQAIGNACCYYSNMSYHQPHKQRKTETYRTSRRAEKIEEFMVAQKYRECFIANDIASEATVRSILYMKALMNLMDQQNGNTFIS